MDPAKIIIQGLRVPVTAFIITDFAVECPLSIRINQLTKLSAKLGREEFFCKENRLNLCRYLIMLILILRCFEVQCD